MTVYAFISHSTLDLRIALALKSGLAPYGIEGFVAHEDIVASQDWMLRIKDELRRATIFIPLVSANFRASLYTDQESGFALALGVPILPISMNLMPYGFIAGIQAIRLGDRVPDGEFIVGLIRAMIDKPELGAQIRMAMVQKFVLVESFIDARDGFLRLRAVGGFTTDHLNALLIGASENRQIFQYGGAIGHMNGLLIESAPTGRPSAAATEAWNRNFRVA